MKPRPFLLISLPLFVVFAVAAAAYARQLHESIRITLYDTQAEPENRNSHPASLEPGQLSAALARIRARSGETGEIIDLFPVKNREEAAAQLTKELRRMTPDQELHLVSFRSIGTLFSGKRNASAARVFVESGRLNLIFGQIDLFFSEFRDPDRPVPPMGSRTQAKALKGEIIPAEGLSFVGGRNDWVALDLTPDAPPPAAVSSVKASDQAQEAASPEAAAKPQEKSIEEKLQILKMLRDKDLITDQEYIEKKRQILDSL